MIYEGQDYGRACVLSTHQVLGSILTTKGGKICGCVYFSAGYIRTALYVPYMITMLTNGIGIACPQPCGTAEHATHFPVLAQVSKSLPQ